MNEGTIAPEQIIINGQEYNSEDATQLIELGSKYRKMESELNTSLDKVYPEYTKASQRNRELETQLAERTAELERVQKSKAEEDRRSQIPEDVQTTRKAARDIGLVDEDYLKDRKYLTRDELDSYFTERQSQQAAVEDINKQGAALEKEIDGSDGRVPFVYEAVLPYASTYKIGDLKDAYERMNERANAKWKAQQLDAEERPGLTTLKPGGKKTPERVKVTDDNFGQMLGEFFDGIPDGQ